MAQSPVLRHRFVLGLDIEKFSGRNTRRQGEVQRDLDRILDEAAASAGLDRSRWHRQPGGDGELAELPDDTDLVALVRGLVGELDALLTEHNEGHVPDRRLRLRLAIHADVLVEGPFGSAGPALVVLSRLLDSAPVRAALDAEPHANLALIVSDSVHRQVVLSEMGGLRARQFREVLVDLPAKSFRETAHVHVPNGRFAEQQPSRPSGPRTAPDGPAERRDAPLFTIGNQYAQNIYQGRTIEIRQEARTERPDGSL